MSNVMEMRNIRNNPSRSGFDLSENTLMTAKAGEVLPFFCKLVMPGDKVELYPRHFSRTVPLNSAAYTSLKESINYFFVPFHLLSNRYDTFLTQMLDNPQHAASLTSAQTVSAESPYFTVNDVAEVLKNAVAGKYKDELGYPIAPKIVKLLSYLGYQDFSRYLSAANTDTSDNVNRRLSPFPLLAYQKIYYDFYRYQQWEKSSPWCFNIDWATYGQSLNVTTLSQKQLVDSLFTLRYANFKKDYFLGVLPSPQFGDSAVVPIMKANDGPQSVLSVKKNNNNTWDNITNGSYVGYTSDLRSVLSNPSVLAIRKAEAIQKLREIQQSGAQDYKEQIEKIFGVTMSQDKSDLCQWLGGYDSDINVSEVVNQTLTGDSDADIKGKGTGAGNGEISQSFDDFGFVIGIYCAIPKLYYDLDCGRVETKMTHSDHYPNPVLDRIGMEVMSMNDVFGDIHAQEFQDSQFGYGPRYFPFKTSYDTVKGGFKTAFTQSGSSLKSWVAPYSHTMLRESIEAGPGSDLRANYLMFKVDPAILNPILSVQVTDGDVVIPYSDDQLLINMSTGAAFVRNLDYDGLPY